MIEGEPAYEFKDNSIVAALKVWALLYATDELIVRGSKHLDTQREKRVAMMMETDKCLLPILRMEEIDLQDRKRHVINKKAYSLRAKHTSSTHSASTCA